MAALLGLGSPGRRTSGGVGILLNAVLAGPTWADGSIVVAAMDGDEDPDELTDDILPLWG